MKKWTAKRIKRKYLGSYALNIISKLKYKDENSHLTKSIFDDSFDHLWYKTYLADIRSDLRSRPEGSLSRELWIMCSSA